MPTGLTALRITSSARTRKHRPSKAREGHFPGLFHFCRPNFPGTSAWLGRSCFLPFEGSAHVSGMFLEQSQRSAA